MMHEQPQTHDDEAPSCGVTSDTGPLALVPLWVIERASPGALQLYALIGASAPYRHDGATYNRRQLAAGCRCDVRTVARRIHELIDLGALYRTGRSDQDGYVTASTYVLAQVAPASDSRKVTND